MRQRLALFVAVAVLIGGIAQAAHYHKTEQTQLADVHLQCLLCFSSTGSAGPPDAPHMVRSEVPRVLRFIAVSVPAPDRLETSSYEARGPPQV